jgi:hypothetical protein
LFLLQFEAIDNHGTFSNLVLKPLISRRINQATHESSLRVHDLSLMTAVALMIPYALFLRNLCIQTHHELLLFSHYQIHVSHPNTGFSVFFHAE